MLKEIKSKYQAKNYEEIEYQLEEQVCPYCGLLYMIDSHFLKTETKNDEDWEVNLCPYCGHKWRICI